MREFLKAAAAMAAFGSIVGQSDLQPYQHPVVSGSRNPGHRVQSRRSGKSVRQDRTLSQRRADPEQAIINGMTNWQRNQWAAAGYPRDRLQEFAILQRKAVRK